MFWRHNSDFLFLHACLIAAVHNDAIEGKHDNNPEATRSTSGLPAVSNLPFEPLPSNLFTFFCLRACLFFKNDLLREVVEERRNEEMEKEFDE